ncbi:MAG: sigma-70 family RNA polymerase sigma factor [Eubacteriaceae bacterium]|jgi:RNA polymerase sigma-70 factor (ECF subfamily)|nr:sigma-70 family RNA polymerase sigma factor [Eubacteriaceae bacterium]
MKTHEGKQFYQDNIIPLWNDVWRLIRSFGVEEHAANDLTQITMVKAYESILTLKKKTSYKSWLFKIAANETKSYLRKMGRILSYDEIDQADTADTDEIDIPEEALLKAESRNLILHALRDLQAEDQSILWLRIVEEIDYKEIEQMLGINSSTLRSRYARALIKLSERYKELESGLE